MRQERLMHYSVVRLSVIQKIHIWFFRSQIALMRSLAPFVGSLNVRFTLKFWNFQKKKREIKVLKNLLNKEILTTDNHPKWRKTRLPTHTGNGCRFLPLWPRERAGGHLAFWPNRGAAQFARGDLFVPFLSLLTFHAVGLGPFRIWHGGRNGWAGCDKSFKKKKSIISYRAMHLVSSYEQKRYSTISLFAYFTIRS